MTPFDKLLYAVISFWLERGKNFERFERVVFNGDVVVTFEKKAEAKETEAVTVTKWIPVEENAVIA